MTKSRDFNNPDSVTLFIQNLDPDFAELVEALRKIILSSDKEIGEQIKWNSPSFFYKGKMKPFDHKEYRRDLVVINTNYEYALLVFPNGRMIDDNTGLLEGDYTDNRRIAKFMDLKEVKAKEKSLQLVVKESIQLVEKL
jgi:hypothetical protein